MVSDSARQRGVLFEGTASSPISEAPPTALGDTWEQFESGKGSTPPPPADATPESVIVTPSTREEGMPVVVEIHFSAPVVNDVQIDVHIVSDIGGGSVWSEPAHLLAGNRSMSHILPIGLPAETFTVRATAGALTRCASFTVTPNTSLQLQFLTATRNNGMIDVTVTLTGPVPTIPGMFADGLLVPLAVDSSLVAGVMVKRNESIGATTISAQVPVSKSE